MDNTNLKVRTMYIPDIWIEAGTQKEQYSIAGDDSDDDYSDYSDGDDDDYSDDDDDDESDNCEDNFDSYVIEVITEIHHHINYLIIFSVGLNEKDIMDKVTSVVQLIREYK